MSVWPSGPYTVKGSPSVCRPDSRCLTTAIPEKKELFLGKISIVRYVIKPTLTIFPALKEKNTGTAVINCPGGAYGFLAYETEGNEVALRFQQLGVTASVLKYRLPHKQFQQNPALAPLQDVQQALRLMRSGV